MSIFESELLYRNAVDIFISSLYLLVLIFSIRGFLLSKRIYKDNRAHREVVNMFLNNHHERITSLENKEEN